MAPTCRSSNLANRIQLRTSGWHMTKPSYTALALFTSLYRISIFMYDNHAWKHQRMQKSTFDTRTAPLLSKERYHSLGKTTDPNHVFSLCNVSTLIRDKTGLKRAFRCLSVQMCCLRWCVDLFQHAIFPPNSVNGGGGRRGFNKPNSLSFNFDRYKIVKIWKNVCGWYQFSRENTKNQKNIWWKFPEIRNFLKISHAWIE